MLILHESFSDYALAGCTYIYIPVRILFQDSLQNHSYSCHRYAPRASASFLIVLIFHVDIGNINTIRRVGIFGSYNQICLSVCLSKVTGAYLTTPQGRGFRFFPHRIDLVFSHSRLNPILGNDSNFASSIYRDSVTLAVGASPQLTPYSPVQYNRPWTSRTRNG